ncbi:MAG: hypothetical protein ACFB16_26250 [Phormidesmis sp.]
MPAYTRASQRLCIEDVYAYGASVAERLFCILRAANLSEDGGDEAAIALTIKKLTKPPQKQN